MTEKLKKKNKKTKRKLFVFRILYCPGKEVSRQGSRTKEKERKVQIQRKWSPEGWGSEGWYDPREVRTCTLRGSWSCIAVTFSSQKRKNEICIVRGKEKSDFFWGTPEGGPAEGGSAEGGPAEGGPAEDGPAEGGPEEEIVQLRSSPAQGRSGWVHERKKLGKGQEKLQENFNIMNWKHI